MTEDIDKRLGELQMAYNAIYRRLAELEKRVRRLENRQPMTGSIQGMEDVIITLPDGWFA